MSLKFKSPELNDKTIIEKLLKNQTDICSENAFGTYFLWSHKYNTEICIKNHILFVKHYTNDFYYEFPRGAETSEALAEAIAELISDAKQNGCKKLKLTELTHSQKKLLENTFDDMFEITPKREEYEYIYNAEDLKQLRGKKYHSKRNHIAKFDRLFKWKYQPIGINNQTECLEFIKSWFKAQKPQKNISEIKEYTAIKKAFENYDKLKLIGGLINTDRGIAACSIGEPLGVGAFLVHFEKALPCFEGAYSVINREFCRALPDNYKLINREEDLGLPGLRKSKLSYHPVLLLKKYRSVTKEEL